MSLLLDHFSGSIVTDTGDLIVSASSGLVRLTNAALQLEAATPQIRFSETDQTGADGKFRFYVNDNAFQLQRNTDAAGQFATATTIFRVAAGSTAVVFDFVPKVLSNDIYHAGNLSLSTISGTLDVAKGGTGQTTFTAGYLKANGATAFSTVAAIPEADITDGTILARVAATETISGAWTINANWTVNSANWTFSNSSVVGVGSGVIRSYSPSDTDITALVPGSTSGLLFEGQNSSHFVIGIRGNDSNDGFYVIDKGNAATPATDPYTNSVLAVSRSQFRYMGSDVRTAANFVAGTNFLAPNGNGSLLTALNATQLTTGTVPNARMAGIYDGITIRLDGTNSVFGMYGTTARTVYDLVQYRSGSSTATGAIVFTAPAAVSSGIMHQMQIRGYTYVSDNRQLLVDFTIFFYRNNTTFTSASIIHRGNWFPLPPIRVGTDASGKTVIIFGDVGTVNPYPHFVCYMASFSHSGATDGYCYGWTSSLVTDLTGYTLSADYNQSFMSGVLHTLDTVLFSGQNLTANVDSISFDDGTNIFTFTADSSITSSVISVGMLRLNRTSTITLTGTTHSFQIGDSAASNLAGDVNGIQSRNNGAAATLNINALGGLVNVGTGGLNSSGTIIIENSAPVLLFRDSTAGQAVGRQYVNTDQMVWQASGDELVWTTFMVADLTGNVYFKPVRVNVTATTAIALAVGTAVPIIVGTETSTNVAISTNHIQARTNGAANGLFLNNLGGLVTIGSGGISTTGNMVITNAAPQIKLQDTTSAQLSGRLRVDANNMYFDSSPDDTTWTEVFRFELDTKYGYAGGKRIYVAGGGLSVAVADGGTGGTDAATGRTGLGLGTAAIRNTGTSGTAVPLLNAAATWSATQTYNNGAEFYLPSSTITFLVWNGPSSGGVPVIWAKPDNQYSNWNSLYADGYIDCLGTTTSKTLRLTSTSDVSLTSTGHAFQIGDDFGSNLIIDSNELQARIQDTVNGGMMGGSFLINASGGNVSFGNTSSVITVNGKLRLPIGSDGGYINGYFYGSASLNFPSTAVGARSTLTLTVAGCAVGDAVFLGMNSTPTAGVIFTAYVSAANTVTVVCQNYSTAAVDPGAITFNAHCLRATTS